MEKGERTSMIGVLLLAIFTALNSTASLALSFNASLLSSSWSGVFRIWKFDLKGKASVSHEFQRE